MEKAKIDQADRQQKAQVQIPQSPEDKYALELAVCNQVLIRWSDIFGMEALTSLFEGTNFDFNKAGIELTEKNTRKNLINDLFFIVYSKRGTSWLSSVEKFTITLFREKGLEIPLVYKSAIFDAEKKMDKLTEASLNLLENREESIEVIKAEKKRTEVLTEASLNLLEMKEKGEKNLKKAIDQLTVDSRTGLGNQIFFDKFIHNALLDNFKHKIEWSLCYFQLDHQEELLLEFGEEKGNESLASAAAIIKSAAENNFHTFKLDGDLFVIYMPQTKIEAAKNIAETIRLNFEQSEIFIRKMTVSIGGVSQKDFNDLDKNKNIVSIILGAARMRVNHARQSGMNRVTFESEIDPLKSLTGKVLVVDTDKLNLDIIKYNFRNNGFGVVAVENGELAYQAVELQLIDLIISEITIPKLDGFSFRQKLMKSSKYINIPFILLSHQKNNADIIRAFNLGISHYLKKPIYVSELLGIASGYLKNLRQKN
ncbi:MAG: response regulator [Candidatus Neomarinimicrobiota bacterium]